MGPPPRLPSAPLGSASRAPVPRERRMTRSGLTVLRQPRHPPVAEQTLRDPGDGQRPWQRGLRRPGVCQQVRECEPAGPGLCRDARGPAAGQFLDAVAEADGVEQADAELLHLRLRGGADVHPDVVETLDCRGRVAAALQVAGVRDRDAGDDAAARRRTTFDTGRPDDHRLAVEELVEEPEVGAGRDAGEPKKTVLGDPGNQVTVLVDADGDQRVRLPLPQRDHQVAGRVHLRLRPRRQQPGDRPAHVVLEARHALRANERGQAVVLLRRGRGRERQDQEHGGSEAAKIGHSRLLQEVSGG